mgnify:CR=1 FL=1
MTSININNLWVEDSQAGEQAILFIHGLGGTEPSRDCRRPRTLRQYQNEKQTILNRN